MIDNSTQSIAPGAPPDRLQLTWGQRLFLSVMLAVMLWLPRGLQLDHFVAVDERSWLTRSGNFYLALTNGDWAATFQRYHPGVTTMWLGMLGFLWQYPDYPADAAGQITSMSEGIEDFLVAQGHAPITLLAAGRSVVVVATVLLLVWAFWLVVDLLGFLPALMGIVLVGFEPLGLGLTRMLHVDGLSATLMLVSVLLFLHARRDEPGWGARRWDLIFSGALAGLAWLTKSPTFMLAPFVMLVAAVDLVRVWRSGRRTPLAALGDMVRDLAVWGGVAALVFVALWPAMWVQPVTSLRAILSAAGESAEIGHSKDIYFNGAVVSGDPGAFFYPITYLWHTTPITLLGLGFALGALVAGRGGAILRGRSCSGCCSMPSHLYSL